MAEFSNFLVFIVIYYMVFISYLKTTQNYALDCITFGLVNQKERNQLYMIHHIQNYHMIESKAHIENETKKNE